MILFYVLILFWIIISVKQILFWVYLWQLKEYHVPRFVDHFRTTKGKELLFNKLRILKIVLLIFFSFYQIFFDILFFLYFIEIVLFFRQIVRHSVKKPKLTKKSLFLIFVCLVVAAIFLIMADSLSELLALDIIMPIVISGIVLGFQPFVAWARSRILAKASEAISQNPHLTVIGITGSYGKTTTKEFLTTILQSKYKVLCTSEHKNSEMGIAQTILKDLKLEHEIFVVEMGAYKKGGIKMLCDMVRPKIGMVTGVTVQHLSLFGSLENLLSAEGGRELAKVLEPHGLIAINGENKYCLDLYKNISNRKVIYTETREKIDSDIYAKEVEATRNNLSFVAFAKDKQAAHFNVNVLGRHNLQNLLGAILVAKKIGMTLEEISNACKNIKPEQAGIVAKTGVRGVNIIDSSYSSNPDGAVADLETLKLFGGKKVVVMPCLIELGKKSAEEHFKIGQKIAEVCDLAIITTKDQFASLRGATKGSDVAIQFIENPQEIFHKITTFCKEGDTVLLEGRVPAKLIELLNGK